MQHLRPQSLTLALLFFTLPPAIAQAGEKDFTDSGKISLPTHKHTLQRDVPYIITVEAKGFEPRVTVRGMFKPFTKTSVKDNVFLAEIMPRETRAYEFVVHPDLATGKFDGEMEYKLTIKQTALAEKPILRVDGRWTDQDPKSPRGTPSRAYVVKLKKDRTYVIDLVIKKDAKAKDDPKGKGGADPYLILEDAGMNIVAQDDDSGGFPNARIVYRPTQDGDFRVIATLFAPATGEYTLTVRSSSGESAAAPEPKRKDGKPKTDK